LGVLAVKRNWHTYILHNIGLLCIFHFLEYYITAKAKPKSVALDGT
jgi:hypothetical protein